MISLAISLAIGTAGLNIRPNFLNENIPPLIYVDLTCGFLSASRYDIPFCRANAFTCEIHGFDEAFCVPLPCDLYPISIPLSTKYLPRHPMKSFSPALPS